MVSCTLCPCHGAPFLPTNVVPLLHPSCLAFMCRFCCLACDFRLLYIAIRG
uniref:Uncharacterized protein n=1 Tax=Arundo donax TaxID=35708 RepID=A0A0A9ED20_ARUDO